MMEIPESQIVEGQTFRKTYEGGDQRTTPSAGLFQPFYYLSEANFLRLKSRSSLLSVIGGGIMVFGITYSLDHFVSHIPQWIAGEHVTLPLIEIVLAAILLLVGATLLIVGLITSSGKRCVIKEIEKHFKDNPGQAEIR
jgi:hypothetical protein